MTLITDGEKTMQKIRVNKEKESTFKSILRWNDKNKKTVLKTTIPAKVVDMLQLTAGNEIVFHIKETELNQYQCDITFKADHLEQLDETVRESASTTDARPSAIDETMTKTVENKSPANNVKSPAGNTIDVTKFHNIDLLDGKYTIKVTTPSRPTLRITGATIKKELNKKELSITVANKSEDEVKEIIDNLINCENPNADKLNDILNKFKSEKYRT